ncbi:hypothetical protein [Quadrisphaera sp. INWT6]|uniref:hypothetical protein n=1 Tax=Quadrisphaera sp. INWT6 TaxID=2596917 RepID=UPI001891F91C|nr:hypothetical protein [Quadrisphaera sp. INWT6]MBF5081502.1 hypothetical protein [Quadrisphaera sp. INWT6]
MSLDPSAVAVHERTAGPAADERSLDPAHWWHETWAAATSPAIPVGRAPLGVRSAVGGSLGSLASRSQLPAWVQRVRAAVWPDACSHAR